METTATSAVQKSIDNNQLPPAQSSGLARFSLADGLYLLVLFAAAILRFTGLNAAPLSPVEATQAFSTWQAVQLGPISTAVGSPAYSSLTAILITFLDSSDVVMRLVPALFGLGLVALPWFLRHRIGQIGALITAVMLAVSPLLAASSQMVGGESIALFALLLTAVAGLITLESGRQNWLYVLAIALGVGLASASLYYGGLLTLLIALGVQRAILPDETKTIWPDRSRVIKAALVALIFLLAVSTRFFTNSAGFGSAVQLFGIWLGQFTLQGDIQTMIAPFLVLGRYEVIIITLGLVAVFSTIWRSSPLGTLFTYWLLTTLLLIILQRGVLQNALLIPIPGSLLLGLATNQVLKRDMTSWTWIVTGIMIFIGAIILVNLARFLRVALTGEQQILNIWIAFVAIAAAALAFYYLWAEHSRAILQGSWLGIMILLVLYQWGTAWYLTHDGANDPRERWVQQAADDELPVLLDTIEKISQSATNSNNDVQLFSAVDSPVLRWYLRDFDQGQIGETLPPVAQYDLIITPVEAEEPLLGSDYLGGDFGLLISGTEPAPVSSTPITDTLRWWLFHESSAPVVEERIILWVRTDLANNER